MASSLDALLAQIKKLQQGAPYDAGLAAAIKSAQYQMSDLDRSYTLGRGDVERMFETQNRDLTRDRDVNVKNTMGSFADRGTLHSGIHAAAQGEVEENYQRGLTNAIERRLAGFRSLDEGRRQSESGIQEMLVDAQEGYSRRQAEAAQSRAEIAARREAQEAANRQAAAAQAQNAAMLRAIAAASAGGGGGGGGSAPRPAPLTGRVNAGMSGPGTYKVMAPGDYDYKFAIIRKMYGDNAAREFLRDNNRYGGLTTAQRQFLTPTQRRTSMVSRRNQ